MVITQTPVKQRPVKNRGYRKTLLNKNIIYSKIEVIVWR